jgi:hypothetical protein
VVAPAHAADEDSNYVIWGVGQKSCHSYSEARSAGKADEYRNFVTGYLTAYNAISADTYNIAPNMDSDAILTWLDGHCDESKTTNFAEAMHQFVTEQNDARAKAAPGNGARWP